MNRPGYLHIHGIRAEGETWRWGFTCRLCGGGLSLANIPNAWETVTAIGHAHLYEAHTPRHLQTYGEAHTYLT